MIHYPLRIPLWVDLVSPDIDASIAFYSDLFGWEVSQAEQTNGYRTFSSGGKIVAGIRPLQGEPLSPQWTTYLSTDDTAQTVSRAEAAGGKVLMETGISEMGMILLQDEVSAVFGIFQNDLFSGAQAFNQPVSLTFNILMTREPLAGKHFYSEVFGWEPLDRKMGSLTFTYFFHGVRGVAGLMAMNEQWSQAVPSHWQVSFAVEDADVLALRAIELGGKAQPPITTTFGRSALITDPHGATFSISQQTPQVRAAAQTPEGVLL
ncbi:MAG: VOC family protein [Ktedonobacteraceae bacterium]|nr:VOC family protein [Ktedonobacteraceae bacterium]